MANRIHAAEECDATKMIVALQLANKKEKQRFR
jgi:hypothetical protein